MENTEENLQGRSAFQIIEIICSVILLICLFLPWVTLQIGGRSTFGMSFDTSYSAFDAIQLITKANAGSSFLPVSQFLVFIYFILVLCIVNPIVQYNKRLPWLSFYTAWVPVLAGMGILFKTTQGGSDGLTGLGMGVGAVLSLLAGLLMQFSAWTTIGTHHKRHRKYFLTALIWCVLGWICLFVAPIVAFSTDFSSFDSLSDNTVLIILSILIYVLAAVGIGHTFWLIYGGIVMLCSSSGSSSTSVSTKRPVQEQTDEFLNQVRTRTDEELKTILQHKGDYNGRLVKAAQIIMLERLSDPDSSVSSDSPDVTPTETEDDKYRAYWPPSKE